MNMIKGGFAVPHPPILIPEIGRGEEKKAGNTLNAFRKVAKEIAKLAPSTIIVTTPHGPVFQDFIHINIRQTLSGDFKKFGAPLLRFQFENDLQLVTDIISLANSEGIPCGGLDNSLTARYKISEELDHGVLVPLYFITQEYRDFNLLHISIAGLSFTDLYRFGRYVSRVVEDSGKSAVFIGSGDLSHRLRHDGPYGFDPSGPEFDRQLVEYFKKPDPAGLMGFDENLLESAGECGLRSFIMMFGALDGYRIESSVYSYEGPFGVGYAVAEFIPGGKAEESLMEQIDMAERDELKKIRSQEGHFVSLARKALEMYVAEGITIGVPDVLPEEMAKKRAGVFVSIKKQGKLRGCIGTISPVRKNIAEEIIHNAISAGTGDPRFDAVDERELDGLVYSVDVLGDAEQIDSFAELDIKRYGVIVRAGRRSGLLLPDLEGVDTPEKQVSIALQKGGISPGEDYIIERFEVIRHS